MVDPVGGSWRRPIMIRIVLTYLALAAATGWLACSLSEQPPPPGVSERGWEDWRNLSDEDREAVCEALRSVTDLETAAIQPLLASGARLPTRPPEPTGTRDMRILCDVPAPDYAGVQEEIHRRQVAAQQAELDLLFYRLGPAAGRDLCAQFRRAGEGNFTYDAQAIGRILESAGISMPMSEENMRLVQYSCRGHRLR